MRGLTGQCRRQSISRTLRVGKKLGGLREAGREAKAEAVARAQELAPLFEELAGLSARELARVFNERGVPTPRGKPWSPVTVLRARRRLT